MLENLSHYGTIAAIPLFVLNFLFFDIKADKSPAENVLLYFSVAGVLASTYSTYVFLRS